VGVIKLWQPGDPANGKKEGEGAITSSKRREQKFQKKPSRVCDLLGPVPEGKGKKKGRQV